MQKFARPDFYAFVPRTVVRDSNPAEVCVCMCVLGMGPEFGIPMPPEYVIPYPHASGIRYSLASRIS